jgi:cyclic-di-AMP phosphodiesterase PgpH
MALFKKNLRQRRLEVRRARPGEPGWAWRWFTRPGVAGGWGIALLFFLLAAGMAIWPAQPMSYRAGQYVSQDVTARVDFRVLDTKLLDDAIRHARSSTPATFTLNEPFVEELAAAVEKMPARLAAVTTLDELDAPLRKDLGIEAPDWPGASTKPAETQPASAPAASQPASAPAPEPPPAVRARLQANARTFTAWRALAAEEKRTQLESIIKLLREELARCYFVRADRASEQLERAAVKVILTDGQTSITQPVGDLVGLNETAKISQRLTPAVRLFPPALDASVRMFLQDRLTNQPLYLYDATRSLADQDAAAEAVRNDPPDSCYRHYGRGKVLAERTRMNPDQTQLPGLTREELDLLAAEHTAFQARRAETKPWVATVQQAARAGVVLLLTLGLVGYIATYQRDLVEKNSRALVLTMLLLVMLAMNKTLVSVLDLNPRVSLLPVVMTGIILAIAYDQRFAMAVGSLFVALAVFQVQAGFAMLLVMLAGLAVCVFQLREIRSRTKLVIVASISATVVFACIWAVGLGASVPWRFLLTDSLYGAGAVLLAGLIIQSLLPVVEAIFGVATGSTLLEWCDASKPLLKRLAMESPGTYNHSLQLGAMCEAAADAIGARGLLTRVGAYYHDIGKLNKPNYFAENQGPGESRHSRLSPAMSLLVIIGHVKDGLEMARQYNLPRQLREFIATHHGTTLVQYFYHTAREKAHAENAAEPDENQFRYPGPRPRSKEAGILMLADGAESSVRAMSEPTPARIRQQVHSITTKRLEDGQLDECELNLREVHLVEESLSKSLCGMYHSRIAYPRQEEELKEAEEKAEAEENTPAPADDDGAGESKGENKR